MTFDQVEAFNRKQLDQITKRYFFVPHPVRLTVDDSPAKNVELSHHPSGNLGTRILHTGQVFYVPQQDAHALQKGDIFRLKDLYNVKVMETGSELAATFAGTELLPDTRKVQWVTEDHGELDVLIPGPLYIAETFNPDSLQVVTGYTEPAVQVLIEDDIVQFERFGFVRFDNGQAILAHK